MRRYRKARGVEHLPVAIPITGAAVAAPAARRGAAVGATAADPGYPEATGDEKRRELERLRRREQVKICRRATGESDHGAHGLIFTWGEFVNVDRGSEDEQPGPCRKRCPTLTAWRSVAMPAMRRRPQIRPRPAGGGRPGGDR